jgi:hypothetical protein
MNYVTHLLTSSLARSCNNKNKSQRSKLVVAGKKKKEWVNNEFKKWLKKMYGNHGEVTTTRGDMHGYLCWTKLIRLVSSLLLCNNSVTSIDNTQLSLYMGYKRKVSYSHYSHIQSYSIFNRINASGLSVPRALIVRVLMFVQHTVGSCFSFWVVW